MFNETVKAAIMIILCVLLLVAAAIIGRGNTAALMLFEEDISEDSIATGLYYSTQALPCMSKNPATLDETKRFVLDMELLDGELRLDYGRLSCANYGAVKYWIGIYDLEESTNQWTFKNFQPQEDDFFMPRYGQIVALNDYSGNKHRAFIGVFVDLKDSSSGKYPLDMFCNSTADSEPGDFISISNHDPVDDNGRGIADAYKYPTNNCESENCIKGPGQLLSTCQPAFHTYSKDTDADCYVNQECKSIICAAGKCANTISPTKLLNGQPCSDDENCTAPALCAHDKRCRDDILNGIDITPFKFV